jgi:hypothetical protein
MLALLSKERDRSRPSQSSGTAHGAKGKIASLFIVPHAALAAQIRHWIYRMSVTVEGQRAEAFPMICQILMRDASNPPSRQASLLRSMPPHILIATPNGLHDVYKADPNALQLRTLKTVVIDEADEMISVVPNLRNKKRMDAIRNRLEKHPLPTLQMLDVIYASRIRANTDPEQAGADKRHGPDPQLIVSSATLRTSLKRYLYGEKGLLRRGKLQKIFGVGITDDEIVDMAQDEDAEGCHGSLLGQAGISHSALVVSAGGKITNIPGAVSAEGSSKPQHSGFAQADSKLPEPDADPYVGVESECIANGSRRALTRYSRSLIV